jgi:hypothetical protein
MTHIATPAPASMPPATPCRLGGASVMGFVALVASISLAQAQQGALKSEALNNTRDMRLCEILVVTLRGIEIYNTTGVSDCPAQLWDALDLQQVRRQFRALKVEKNGPHFWMMDAQTVSFGTKASFGGIDARWVARLPLATALESATGSKPYKVFTSKKTQKMVYEAGKPVYEIVDPNGNVYVLQAHEKQFPLDTLAKLGEQLKLPKGWQFHTQNLSEDLVLDLTPNQVIYAVGDEFHQYWTRIPKPK